MPAAPPQFNLRQWENQFLTDIGAPKSAWASDYNFLNQWVGREGGMATKGYNPLFTTMTGPNLPGSWSTNSVGVQAYPTMQEGALANAEAIQGSNPGYAQLLQGLRAGNLDPSGTYQGLGTWSGNSYNTIAGSSVANPNDVFGQPNPAYGAPPGLTGQALANWLASQAGAKNAAADQQMTLVAQAQMEQWVQDQSGYARTQSGYDTLNLALSQQDLASQEAALQRQLGLAPKEQAIQEKEYGQEFADMLRNYQSNKESQLGSQAGAGNFFTRGARTDRSNLLAGYQSQHNMLALQKQGEELNYREQINQLKDQQAALKRMGERYGISAAEIKTRLAQQLSNIRYGGLQSLYPLSQQLSQDQLTQDLANFYAQGIQPTGTTNPPGKPKPKPKKPKPHPGIS